MRGEIAARLCCVRRRGPGHGVTRTRRGEGASTDQANAIASRLEQSTTRLAMVTARKLYEANSSRMVHHLPLGNLIANKINYTFAAIAGSHLPLRRSGESQVESSNVDRSISGPPRASLRLATCNRPFHVSSEIRTIEIDGSILRRYASDTERVQESYTEVLAREGERDPAWPASGCPRSGGVNSRTEGQRGRDA